MRYLVLAVLVLAARPADACAVPDFGHILAKLGEAVTTALDPQTEEIATPLISIGGGTSTEGQAGAVQIGYGWGERDRGGLFPGSALTRVMAGVRRDSHTAVSLTFGWYETQIGSGGLDVGIEHQLGDGSTGPIARLTIGASGIAARLGGGFMFGGDRSRAVGQLEIVVEVMDLVNRI